MKRPAFRLDRALVVVALIAVNLAVFRSLFTTRRIDLLFCGSTTWIILEVATYRAFRSRGKPRAFWLGFAGLGSLATITRFAGQYDPTRLIIRCWRGWDDFMVFRVFEPWYLRLGPSVTSWWLGPILEILMELSIMMGPILFAALVGGLMARQISSWRSREPAVIPPALTP